MTEERMLPFPSPLTFTVGCSEMCRLVYLPLTPRIVNRCIGIMADFEQKAHETPWDEDFARTPLAQWRTGYPRPIVQVDVLTNQGTLYGIAHEHLGLQLGMIADALEDQVADAVHWKTRESIEMAVARLREEIKGLDGHGRPRQESS